MQWLTASSDFSEPFPGFTLIYMDWGLFLGGLLLPAGLLLLLPPSKRGCTAKHFFQSLRNKEHVMNHYLVAWVPRVTFGGILLF